MDLQQFVTTEFGTKLWMALGRWLPPRAGYAFARLVAGIVARRRQSIAYRILYENQAGVRGLDTPPDILHKAVCQVLEHHGRTAYDLMHFVALGQEAIRAAVTFSGDLWDKVDSMRASGRGVMLCGSHTSNFNLVFLALSLYENMPAIQVLSPPKPTGGFEIMHELRQGSNILETPIDGASLHQAIARLRAGGYVATGVDWPLAAAPDDILPFFGRPAHLPMGHIRLAISGKALLLPLTCRWSAERGYHVLIGEPIEPELTGDRVADVRHNALRVLAVIERWIAEQPDQWLMYHPVWAHAQSQESEC